jgi:hypothetical protein
MVPVYTICRNDKRSNVFRVGKTTGTGTQINATPAKSFGAGSARQLQYIEQ